MTNEKQNKKPLIDFGKIKEEIKNFRFDKEHLLKLLPFLLEILLLAVIIVGDLLSKKYLLRFLCAENGAEWYINHGLTYSEAEYIDFTAIKGFLDLEYSLNTGMGFGMMKDGTVGLIVITSIVIVALLAYLTVYHKDSEFLRVPLIMIAGGGIGNLVDRIALGAVRDFFKFTFVDFAVFNVADSFVTVGAILLIIYLVVQIFKPSKKDEESEKNDDEEEMVIKFVVPGLDDDDEEFQIATDENAKTSKNDNLTTQNAENGNADNSDSYVDGTNVSGGEKQSFTIESADEKEKNTAKSYSIESVDDTDK